MEITIPHNGSTLTMTVYHMRTAPEDFGAVCVDLNSCYLGSGKYAELNDLFGMDKRKFFAGLIRVSPDQVMNRKVLVE